MAKYNNNKIKEALKEAGINALKEATALTAVANEPKQFVAQVKIDINNPSPVEDNYLLEKVDAAAITEKAEITETAATDTNDKKEEKKYTEEEHMLDLNTLYFLRNDVNVLRKKRHDASFCNIAPRDITKEFLIASNKLEMSKNLYERKYDKKINPGRFLLNTPSKYIYSITCESCDVGVYPTTVYITEDSAIKILNNNKIEKKFSYGTGNILCSQNGYDIRLIRLDLGEMLIDNILTLEDALHKILLDDKRFKSAEDQKESSEELQ